MDSLVHPREKVYFVMCLAVTLLFYAYLIAFLPYTISLVGYVALWKVIGFIAQGLIVGQLKGNCLRVSERQFPEVYGLARQIGEEMGFDPVPPVYVLQGGGALNAFATRFLGRNFVVIYSDVLELAYREGEPALAFIVGHELGHVRRRHVFWYSVLAPAVLIPFLAYAYYRACEYTADRFGARYGADGAIAGLLVLAAGKRLYRRVNLEEVANQAVTERGFWVWLAEWLSTHPHLASRIRAVQLFRSAAV